MGCKDKNKFVTAEASSKASLKSKGAIDEFLNIKDENLFRRLNREWSNNAKERFGITEKLFLEENGRVFPNKAAFKLIDNAKGIFYETEKTNVNTQDITTYITGKLEGSQLSQEIEGKLEANKDRLIELLGSSMYSEKLKDVVYKELLQNAFDATKIAEAKGLIDKGKVDIEINEKERIISFSDNGIGMTSDIVQKAFFTIGGTFKGDDVDNKLKSGGLGLAKMAFIFGSETLSLETVHNGIKTTVNATSQEIRTDNFKIKTENTNEKNGTRVSVKIPTSYVDSKGENRSIDFPQYSESEFRYSFLSNPLIGNVDVNYSIVNRDASYKKEESQETSLGKLPEGFVLFSPASTSFADMDIYIDTNNVTKGYFSDTKHQILSSGLYQFDIEFKTEKNETLPLNIIIDIKPKVDATNSQYPFNNQRENFKPTVKSDIAALNKYLGLLWNSIEIELLKNSFSKIKNIDAVNVENVDSSVIEKNKEITKKFTSSSNTDIITSAIEDFNKTNEKAIIEDGGLRTKQLLLSKEDIDKDVEKGYSRTFKADRDITINRDAGIDLDSNKPIIHNNTNMDIDAKSTKFLSEISSIMIDYKKSIIDFYGEDYSDNIKTQLWGVSIDKGYGGVNVNPSLVNMLAINPFYNFPTNPKVDAVNYIAVALDHLIIHELNHNFERNEGSGFTGRFLTTYSEIHSLPNYFELISKLKLSIKNNLETIKKLNYEYQQSENVESGFEGNKLEANNERGTDIGDNTISQDDSSRNERAKTDDVGSGEQFGEIISSKLNERPLQQKRGGPVSTPAAPKTIKLLKDFIKSIGVVIKDVKTINVNGVKYDADGIAMLMQKLIQVVEGTEAQSLPEEAMHFAVAIIKQTNPKLYKKLMSEINNYQMLQDVFDTYGNDPDYQIDGKTDVIALKEEAIAKVLAQTIINNNENSSEKPEMVAKSQSWWMDILDALKNLFIKSGFDKLSMDIISGKKIGTAADIREDENRFFLQKTKQEEVVNRIREVSDKITLEPVKNEAGGEENKYFINGQQIKNRVSNIIKTYYDILRSDKALNDSEYKKATNTLKADKGTAGHKDKEHAMEIMLDENGRLKSKDELDAIFANDNHVSFIDPNNNDMYILLRNNLRKRMESFPKDTVFMSEITVYDAKRNLAGTVDFLAITPEGKVNILDWKFVGLNVERYKDIPWYNVSSWNKQMAQYKIILRDNYGINEKDFEQTRMIPIRAIYSDGDAKKNILPVLLEVEIGDANVKNIKSDYLLPVGLQNEKVVIENNPEASDRINKLLEKLNDVYTKLSDQKVLPSERLDKAEQLNALYSAIRQLQMRQDIRPLLYQAKVLNVQIQGIIQKYNDEIKSKDQSELSDDEIEEFVKTLKIAEDALGYYTNLDTELEFLFEGSISEEDKNLSVELRETVYNSRKLKETLGKVFTEFTVEKIGGTEQGEKIVKDVFSKWLGTTSTIQLEGMAALFKKANAAFGRAGMDTQTEVARLKELKKSFEQWAARKGLSKGNMFSMIKKKDSNELIDQYQDTFYDTLNRKIQTKDFTWIRDNVDVAAYQDYLNEKIEKERKRIEDKPRLGTEEQNYNEITREWFDLKNLYDISTPQSVGWLLYNDVKKFPKDKWETNEWKDLHKKENEAALNFYNYIIERNEVYAKTGYIPAGSARVFLPWVRKGLMEKLAMGGKITIGEQFLKNISVDEEEIGFGKFDPINGKPINRLPKYLTSKFEEQYSEDLFKTMAMYNEFAIKFQYLASIENQALALLRLEENKQAIATSKFGRTNIKNGEIQYTNNNDENSKLLEDMIKAIVYQQKYIESESYDQLLGNLGNFGKNINKTLGFKLLPENLDGRQISINKAITHMNNTFQVTALGLNILSASSNYFGGTAQGLVNAGKYFTKAEYAASEAWLLSFKMAGNLDKQKVLAALDYFIPFTDNYNRRAATKLSLNKLDDQAIQDWLMSLMRGGDEAVQTVNFVSFLKNSIIVDGKVVNSREYLRNTDEYRDFYQGTQSERDARADKFEKDVKAINEKQGVLALSTVVNGELVIPGVERKSDSVLELRRKVQGFTADALGSMTEENKRLMNLNIYGNSFMVFKNWIPRLVDVRFGNIKYNAASDAYEWGRTRMITRIITDDLKGAIGNLKNSLMGNDKGMEYIRQLYEKKRADYKADTNKELKMTESEFIDLVRGNIKNQMLDVLLYATLWAIVLGLKALAPDDDEDPAVRNRWNFMLKATDKFKDELGYFYNPGSLISIPQKGIFPALGLLNNYEKAVEGFLKETYALGTGDDELAEDTKTIKYWMKTNPITNQAAGMLPIFYPELAKDLGIRMQSQYGIR